MGGLGLVDEDDFILVCEGVLFDVLSFGEGVWCEGDELKDLMFMDSVGNCWGVVLVFLDDLLEWMLLGLVLVFSILYWW